MSLNNCSPLNPNTCSWTSSDVTDLTDLGQCVPASVRRTCDRPVLPVQTCPNEVVSVEFDPETESFTLLGQWLDQNCEPILDENGAVITTPIN